MYIFYALRLMPPTLMQMLPALYVGIIIRRRHPLLPASVKPHLVPVRSIMWTDPHLLARGFACRASVGFLSQAVGN